MLAIDLGGTRVKAALVTDGVPGQVLVRSHASGQLGPALETVEAAIGLLLADGPVDAVGMCVPGLVDDDGCVTSLPGKLAGIVGADLTGWLTARTGAPAVVVNDAVAYGVGVAADLPGRTVAMTLGTGVGTAVVEDGRPLGRGPLGGGLLGGQLPLTDHGPTDTAGRHGTVEAWCRADRLLAEVRDAGCDAADVSAAYDAALTGDAQAVAGLRAYQGWLARGIAALCLAYTPDTVVVGGGPVRADGLLVQGLTERVLPLLWPGQSVEVRASELGDASPLRGLSVLVDRRAKEGG